ncbi:hypothetical protein [Clostridium sp. Marseille-QA1073]
MAKYNDNSILLKSINIYKIEKIEVSKDLMELYSININESNRKDCYYTFQSDSLGEVLK